ncbi:MAG: hypothetical protein O2820_25825 [Planctomycetota bacterium]|nr:hypothetical protein [Planctomycetota bacterium]MDA1252632.1 hypothetical protein [Planctomycetota bacterium]
MSMGTTDGIKPARIESEDQLIWLLMGDVAEILDDGLDAENISWLGPVLDVLMETMACQQRNETGYLTEVLVEFPNWSSQVDRLRSERSALDRSLEDLQARIRWSLPVDMLAFRLQVQVRNWLNRMQLHRCEERELVQAVWYNDIGTCD